MPIIMLALPAHAYRRTILDKSVKNIMELTNTIHGLKVAVVALILLRGVARAWHSLLPW